MPYPQSEVVQYGAAPNPSVNTTLAAAQSMADHWKAIERVEGIFVNTTVPAGSGPVAASMINVLEVEPPLDTDSPPLFYQVRISGQLRVEWDAVKAEWVPVDEPVLTNYFAVCQWGPICASIGVRAATIQYLDLIDPNWKAHQDTAGLVYALPTLTYPAPIITSAPAPAPIHSLVDTNQDTGLASPDWNVWVGYGWLAIRAGDTSAFGTVFQDLSHGRWVKRREPPTPFSPIGGNARWQMELELP